MGLSVLELNRIDMGVGMESSGFEEIEQALRWSIVTSGKQAEISVNLGNHAGVFKGSDNL